MYRCRVLIWCLDTFILYPIVFILFEFNIVCCAQFQSIICGRFLFVLCANDFLWWANIVTMMSDRNWMWLELTSWFISIIIDKRSKPKSTQIFNRNCTVCEWKQNWVLQLFETPKQFWKGSTKVWSKLSFMEEY